MSAINGEELAALNHEFNTYPSGSEFLDVDHPYALDLDIFGDYSMFQYACRATTVIGRTRLAEYLSNPAEIPEIVKRQQAVSELKPMLDWRQHFYAYGNEIKDDPGHLQKLNNWLGDEDMVRGNNLLKAAIWLAPVWFVICVLLWVFYVPWQVFLLLFLIPPGIILRNTKERVDRTHLRTMHAGEMLSRYAVLLKQIEEQGFNAEKLNDLKKAFTDQKYSRLPAYQKPLLYYPTIKCPL